MYMYMYMCVYIYIYIYLGLAVLVQVKRLGPSVGLRRERRARDAAVEPDG